MMFNVLTRPRCKIVDSSAVSGANPSDGIHRHRYNDLSLTCPLNAFLDQSSIPTFLEPRMAS